VLDTNGARIQAHGGSILYPDGVFYWYGENKERTTQQEAERLNAVHKAGVKIVPRGRAR
jgi:hypothetical protein